MRIVRTFVLSLFCVFFLSGCKPRSITVATWNIGHFSNGQSANSSIKGENYDEKLKSYKKLFSDLGADILFLNEYSKLFGVDKRNVKRKTKKVLLNHYSEVFEGDQVGFSCNAIFSHYKVTNVERHEFRCTAGYVKELPRAANYYYISGDLHYKRNVTKLICVHTISSNSLLCHKMIDEIINIYKDFDRVIMCGDWNTGNYERFVTAGFSLANDGSLKTYPQKRYPLDNVIVKGLKINNVRLLETDLSDHYPLVCNITLE